MPKVGLEPTRTHVHWILSPARLPFRHFGYIVTHANRVGRLERALGTDSGNHRPDPPLL